MQKWCVTAEQCMMVSIVMDAAGMEGGDLSGKWRLVRQRELLIWRDCSKYRFGLVHTSHVTTLLYWNIPYIPAYKSKDFGQLFAIGAEF